MFWEPEFWGAVFERILADLMQWLPALGVALVLLLVGWVAAHLAQWLVGAFARRLGIDRLGERLGAGTHLETLGVSIAPSRFLARLTYWIVLLLVFLVIGESLGIRLIAEALRGLGAYLPRVLAAILVLLLGALAARLLGHAAGLFALQAGMRGGAVLGLAVRYTLLIVIVILALEQLGLDTTLLVFMAIAVLGAAALALAIAFGWGSRELARNIMAGFHAREEFIIGRELTVQGHRGRLVRIGSVKTVLETESGRVSIPNRLLVEEEVLVRNPGEEA